MKYAFYLILLIVATAVGVVFLYEGLFVLAGVCGVVLMFNAIVIARLLEQYKSPEEIEFDKIVSNIGEYTNGFTDGLKMSGELQKIKQQPSKN